MAREERNNLMQKEFTKADLEYGYLVVLRKGDKALYMPSIDGDSFDFQNDAECLLLDRYNEDLTSMVSEKYDIVEVYGFARPYDTLTFDLKRRGTLWQRNETKRMTVEEMRVKLEELLGEKIEVEASRFEMITACEEYCIKQHNAFGCKQCPMREEDSACNFREYTDEFLKQCYEKVMEDGDN